MIGCIQRHEQNHRQTEANMTVCEVMKAEHETHMILFIVSLCA